MNEQVQRLIDAAKTLLANAEFADGEGSILTQDAEELEAALKAVNGAG